MTWHYSSKINAIHERTKCLSFVSSISISRPLAYWERDSGVPYERERERERERKAVEQAVKRVNPRKKERITQRREKRKGRKTGRERWGRDWNGIRGMSCNNRPPFDRLFQRETAPPLSSAWLILAQLNHDDDEETDREMLTHPSFYLVRNNSGLLSSKVKRQCTRLFYLKKTDLHNRKKFTSVSTLNNFFT